MPRLNGKFVSQAAYDEAMKEQETAVTEETPKRKGPRPNPFVAYERARVASAKAARKASRARAAADEAAQLAAKAEELEAVAAEAAEAEAAALTALKAAVEAVEVGDADEVADAEE